MANAPQFPPNPLPPIIGGTVNVLAGLAATDFPVTDRSRKHRIQSIRCRPPSNRPRAGVEAEGRLMTGGAGNASERVCRHSAGDGAPVASFGPCARAPHAALREPEALSAGWREARGAECGSRARDTPRPDRIRVIPDVSSDCRQKAATEVDRPFQEARAARATHEHKQLRPHGRGTTGGRDETAHGYGGVRPCQL